MQVQYSKFIQKIGGRKFTAILLSTILTFLSVILAFTIDSQGGWSFVTFMVPWYYALIGVWSGLQIYQKKVLLNK